jgi:AcrR family transcriptional regulator
MQASPILSWQQRQTLKTQSPHTPRKRRSTAEVTDRLLQAARQEFKRVGFAGATTAAIAQNAGVTEAQLFRHYGSKVGLFHEAIFKPLDAHFEQFNQRHLNEVSEVENIRDQAQLYIAELRDFIGEHAQMILSLLVAQTYSPESTQSVGDIDSLREYFQHGADTMLSRMSGQPKVDPQLMVRVSFAAVLANVIFKDWLFPKGLASDQEIGAAITDFVINGISVNHELASNTPSTI